VNNDYSEEIDPEKPALLSLEKVSRKIIADQPRVTHFPILWDNGEEEYPSDEEIKEGEEVVDFDMSEEEEIFSEDEECDSLSDDVESSEGMMNTESNAENFQFVFSC
jgi:hypothetical protein